MELTIQIRRLEDGRYRAEAPELPNVFYVGRTEDEARERMERLAHALRSPHIHIDRVTPDGDVILTLRREEGGEDPEDCENGHARAVFDVSGLHSRSLMLVG